MISGMVVFAGKFPERRYLVKILNWKEVKVSDNPHGVDARKMYDTEHAQVIHILLKPGESLKKHITPVDVIFYVLEGRGTVEIGDEKKEVDVDSLIESPAGIPHCWYNEGDKILRFLVIKVPRPVKPTRLL